MTQLQMLTGVMFAFVALMAVWAFRTAGMALGPKIGLFLALVGFACAAPFVQYQARDLPIPMTVASLPHCIDIIAFKDFGLDIDIWLDNSARIVRIPSDSDTTKVFAKVREALQSGERFVRLCKNQNGSQDGTGKSPGNGNLDQDSSKMHIDESLFLKNMKPE